jgi:lipoprotein-releasing system permease protein
LLGATAHVSILEKERAEGIENWQELAKKLSRIPHVTSSLPGLYDSGYISGPITGGGAVIKGISVGPEAKVPDTLLHLKAGSLSGLTSAEGERPGIILGSRLAENIGAVVGKPVQLLVPNGQLTPFGPRPTFVSLRVAGTFESGFYDLDMNWAFMALPQVQKAFGLADVVNSIELRLDDIYRADEVAAAAAPLIGAKLGASTWQEQNRPLLNALKLDRIVTVVTTGLIQVIAALNILIALVMMVMEKHRDIAILLSMGARTSQIRKIFILEGALIGGVGTTFGLVAGYTICYLADHFRWLKLDEQIYSVSYVPFSPHWTDGVWIAAAAMLVSLVATLYPARSATRIAPVEALRYE